MNSPWALDTLQDSWVLLRALFWAVDCQLLVVASRPSRRREHCAFPPHRRALISPPLRPHPKLPKLPFPDTITVERRSNIWIWRAHSQPITRCRLNPAFFHLKPECSRLHHWKFVTNYWSHVAFMCLEITLHFLCLSFTLPLPLFISLAWWLCLLFHPESTRNQKKNSPACTPAFIHFPASECISCALHPVTMNGSCSYPRPALSLLHQILSVCLTTVCFTIPPTMLPAFFRWSIFPFLLDHSHQHQTCCNFSHLKINKTKPETITYIHIPLQFSVPL